MTAARYNYEQTIYLDALCPACGYEFAIRADVAEVDRCPECHWDGKPQEQMMLFGEGE